MNMQKKLAIIGLGYVGLPLAVAFAKKHKVIGFDIDESRIKDLNQGNDQTREISKEALLSVMNLNQNDGLYCSNKIEDIADCQIYIVTVPTPVDKYNHPDLTPLYKASAAVGKVLKQNDIIIYESTVYPGATEEECVPVLERVSGLTFNKDFFAGYSPERINPGDKKHTVTVIKKVTSGSTPDTAEEIDQLYKTIITAGTHKASSIKVAEAAKVIENSQRDINIAFVNELSKIFHCLGIDTKEVLEAAGTKWNFLNFSPGLVGGHCIGVDPFYLAQKAQEKGYHPEIILAGRRLNDSMGGYVAHEVIKLMIKKGISVKGSSILILGITFKENCPDIRNTKVIDIITTLKEYEASIAVYDPWARPEEVEKEYRCRSFMTIENKVKYDAVILAVAHNEFNSITIKDLCMPNAVVYDVKGLLSKEQVDGRL